MVGTVYRICGDRSIARSCETVLPLSRVCAGAASGNQSHHPSASAESVQSVDVDIKVVLLMDEGSYGHLGNHMDDFLDSLNGRKG